MSIKTKANICYNVPASEIPKRISTEFRDMINTKILGNNIFTLINFPSSKSSSNVVITPKILLKTINKLEEQSNKIIIVAHGFTVEALELLAKQEDIICFYKSNFPWTDESWVRIHNK